MKVLHFVKTSDGARWACEMVAELVKLGVEVTVVLPHDSGKMIDAWKKVDAKLIYAYTELPVKKIWNYFKVKKRIENIVSSESPDVIHTHFFSQAMILRRIKSSIPTIFQVPGPLHLEKFLFRFWDIKSARENDLWIASSKFIRNFYINSGIDPSRVGLSYYGNKIESYNSEAHSLKEQYKISNKDYVIGNLSYFYPPKKYLLQKVGLKGHELLIKVANKLKVTTLLFGGQLGAEQSYFNKLKKQAGSNVIMPGPVQPFEVSKAWNSLDVCVHIPLSENCGGVLEPLIHKVPVIASDTGALGELIVNKTTGLLIDRNEESIEKAIRWAKENPELMKSYAQKGNMLALKMFDVERTAKEIFNYYNNLNNFDNVEKFDSKEFLKNE